jgi:hypothetical protein
MYIVFFISFIVSSTCFGCYLHPSSGAQLPRTAIGFVWFWCVIPLELVLVWDILTLKHGQLQTGLIKSNTVLSYTKVVSLEGGTPTDTLLLTVFQIVQY